MANDQRRHDLDALRAIAMLLGIMLHAGLSFTQFPWPIQDSQQTPSLFYVYTFIHGFRMPLFFMLSGFFTAMLWRKRGLRALIANRFYRIFLPLLLSMITIIPAIFLITKFVNYEFQYGDDGSLKSALQAVLHDNNERLDKILKSRTFDINEFADGHSTLLTVAAFTGNERSVKILLENGADLNRPNVDGGTALHAAAFLGRWEAAQVLIERGADVAADNRDGVMPIESAQVDWEFTKFICDNIGTKVDRDQVFTGRSRVVELLIAAGSPDTRPIRLRGTDPNEQPGEPESGTRLNQALTLMTYFPLFFHLWFLWFLCIFLVAFALYAKLADSLDINSLPRILICSPLNLLWLVPLTMVPESFMDPEMFGPDNCMGLIPVPAVLAYYFIFFFFGALYWDAHDQSGQLGHWWIVYLTIAVVIVLPLGIYLQANENKEALSWIGQIGFNFFEAMYAWLMIVGSIGLFRATFSRESKAMRYLSDSSYWLYLAHLPLVFIVQWLMRDWPIAVWPKFILVCAIVAGLLLASYQLFVRHTWIGALLNGRRPRTPTPSLAIGALDQQHSG